jgi:hypothetical protein
VRLRVEQAYIVQQVGTRIVPVGLNGFKSIG